MDSSFGFVGSGFQSLVAEFISPPKVYTFSFIVGNIIPKSVRCIHSATKNLARGKEEGFLQCLLVLPSFTKN